MRSKQRRRSSTYCSCRQGICPPKGRVGNLPSPSSANTPEDLEVKEIPTETSEGLDKLLSPFYYFPHALHPVTTPTPAELALDFNNLDLNQKFSPRKAAVHAITMTDFAFEKFAAEKPAVSSVHSCLGLVQTGFFKELTFVLKATATSWLLC